MIGSTMSRPTMGTSTVMITSPGELSLMVPASGVRNTMNAARANRGAKTALPNRRTIQEPSTASMTLSGIPLSTFLARVTGIPMAMSPGTAKSRSAILVVNAQRSSASYTPRNPRLTTAKLPSPRP